MLVLGLDIGTQSVKALVLDSQGAVRGVASAGYPLQTPRPGWAEQDPEAWWAATCEAVRKVTSLVRDPVSMVALSGQMHGVVLLNVRHELLRPAILWTDVRATAEAAELRATEPELPRISGNPIMASYTAPKLMWIARHEAALLERARWFLLPKDYIRLRLTGELATDPSDASGTLLFDLQRRQWAADIIRRIGLDPAWFPPVVPSDDVGGYVTRQASEQTGLRQGTPVLVGGADMPMAAVGAGLVEPDVAGVLLSSAGQVILTVEHLLPSALGHVYYFAHVIRERYLAMGAVPAAGLSLSWLRSVLREESFSRLDEYGTAVVPGSSGLLFLPYLAGTGTPYLDADARGAFVGLGLGHGPGALARAVMEGVAFCLKDSLDAVRAATREGAHGCPRLDQTPETVRRGFREVRAGGGGARSQLWLQILADVFDAPVAPLRVGDASPLGAALLALVGIGAFGSVSEAQRLAVKVGEPLVPRVAAARRYAALHVMYRGLYSALREVFGQLAAFREEGERDAFPETA